MLAVFFSGGRRLKKYVFSSRKGHGLFSYSQERSGLETEQGHDLRHFHPGLFTGSSAWEALIIKSTVLYLAYFLLYGCVM